MITIKIKMNTNKYMNRIDNLFDSIQMQKVDEGIYSSDGDALTNCYHAAKELMKRDWFREDEISMSWIVDDEPEEDLLVPFYKERVNYP